MKQQNFINHIALVLDASGSMDPHKSGLIKATDDLIKYLATRSQELDQETRVTIYTFDDIVKCAIYEKDVLRLPSIATLYKIGGMTALIDATMLSQEDLALQPQKYGDHAFLTYVLTDGAENGSKLYGRDQLSQLLRGQPENWTVAALVPDMFGKQRAQDYGFPKDNIAIWDTTSAHGAEQATQVIRGATDTFMTSRVTGTRGSKNLFQMNTAAATSSAVKQLAVKPLERGKFILIPPPADDKTAIKDMVEGNGLKFRIGLNYYQMMKPEKIQADKKVALVRKQRKGVAEADVFVGYEIRDFLGLPDHEVRVEPGSTPDYDIFVQSNSNNRHMMKNQRLLVLEPAYK